MMKKSALAAIVTIVVLTICAAVALARYFARERTEQLHFERQETEVVITNLTGGRAALYTAGKNLAASTLQTDLLTDRLWMRPGRYYLKVQSEGQNARETYYPISLTGYRSGPDSDNSFNVTIRNSPPVEPPQPASTQRRYVHIPSGNFLFGDRLNPKESHHVWLPAFFISPFEITNAEFSEFLNTPNGYESEENWTEAGRDWKRNHPTKASARLNPAAPDYGRFGQPDQPVTGVSWYEAAAYCRWLTRSYGGGRWIYGLPSEAEWEKAARGPDDFDYGLSQTISDQEVTLYNWKKNPDAPITVTGIRDTQAQYQPNRFGLYHMSGNVAEWTASINQSFNRDNPYSDPERNRDDLSGQRIVRGGSWYSASIALLSLAYRDTFQPEVSHHDLGFRIVVRPLP